MDTKVIKAAQRIKLLICDVDGVLTDGHFHFNAEGIGHLAFHVHDGYGLKLLMYSGVEVGIITASNNRIVDQRIHGLEIPHYYKGQFNKIAAYEKLTQKLSLNDDQVAYVGDDLPDLPLIQRVGLGVAVANATKHLHQHALLTTNHSGGNGAVREVCDLLMQAQGTLDSALENYRDYYAQ